MTYNHGRVIAKQYFQHYLHVGVLAEKVFAALFYTFCRAVSGFQQAVLLVVGAHNKDALFFLAISGLDKTYHSGVMSKKVLAS